MKKIGLALASAFLAFGSLTVRAQEMPFSFGIKAGYLNPNLTGLEKAKGPWKGNSESDLIVPSFTGGLYGEYAFHEYVGAGLESFYSLTGADLHKKGDDKQTLSIRVHQINVRPMVRIYPMARDIDEGIFSVALGPDVILPLFGKSTENGKTSQDIDKAELTTINLGAFLEAEYELPIGLLVGSSFSYGFMSTFTEDSKFKADKLGMAKGDNVSPWYMNLTLGYNFARLLEE